MSGLKTLGRGTIVLALAATLTIVVVSHTTPVYADPSQGLAYDDPTGGGSGGVGLGDPDQPEDSKANKAAGTRIMVGSQQVGSRVAGDNPSQSAWMWRFFLSRLWQRGIWLLP